MGLRPAGLEEPAHAGTIEHDPEDPDRGGVCHQPANRGGPESLRLDAADRVDHCAGLVDLGFRGREHFVSDWHLIRMDAPLPDRTEGRGPGRFSAVPPVRGVVGVGAVDRVDAMGAGRDDHPRPRVVPEVAWVGQRISGSADLGNADPLARGQIPESENEGLEPRGAGGDLLDVRERFSLFDQDLQADPAFRKA